MSGRSFISYLLPKHMLRYGQEYIDKRLRKFKPRKKASARVCKECGVAWVAGRWTWDKKPLFSKKCVCPACRRMLNNRPAAVITLRGEPYKDHLIDISALVKHFEMVEKHEHPLSRVIDVSTQGKVIIIRTTTTKMAASISSMIQRAFGAISINRDVDESGVLRVVMNG